MNNENFKKKVIIYNDMKRRQDYKMTGAEISRELFSPEILEKYGIEGPFKTEEEKQKEMLDAINSIPDSMVEGKTESEILDALEYRDMKETIEKLKKIQDQRDTLSDDVRNMTGAEISRELFSEEKLAQHGVLPEESQHIR